MEQALTADILTRRIAALQRLLAQRDIPLAVLTHNTDLYYYTGSLQPSYLLVRPEGDPLLLARKAFTRIAEEVPHLPAHAFAGSKDLQAILYDAGLRDVTRIGCTLDTLSYAAVQRLQPLFPAAEIVDLSWHVRTLRMVKDDCELALLRRAAEIMAQVPALMREHFRPGITELALSAALEYAVRLQGHGALIRPRREGVEMSGCGVLTAGVHALAGTKFEGVCGGQGLSAAVPYGASNAPIPPNTPILVDYAVVYGGYHIDQTRMFCWGQPSDEVARAHQDMLDIEQAVIDRMRPGTPWEELYTLSLDMATRQGYADTFMGAGREQVKFVGHGVGLELDEPPFLAPKMPAPLEAGMVIAIEPKVALPGVGIVGIEDNLLVRDGEPELLTTCERNLIVL